MIGDKYDSESRGDPLLSLWLDTTLVPLSETKAVPEGRIMASGIVKPVEVSEKITVARNAGEMFGAAIAFELWVDGKPAAEIPPGSAPKTAAR